MREHRKAIENVTTACCLSYLGHAFPEMNLVDELPPRTRQRNDLGETAHPHSACALLSSWKERRHQFGLRDLQVQIGLRFGCRQAKRNRHDIRTDLPPSAERCLPHVASFAPERLGTSLAQPIVDRLAKCGQLTSVAASE